MNILGWLMIVFGLVVIAYPQFLAYLIGFFFFFVGINILLMSMMTRRKGSAPSGWKVGAYEITKRK